MNVAIVQFTLSQRFREVGLKSTMSNYVIHVTKACDFPQTYNDELLKGLWTDMLKMYLSQFLKLLSKLFSNSIVVKSLGLVILMKALHVMFHRPVLTTDGNIQTMTARMSFSLLVPNNNSGYLPFEMSFYANFVFSEFCCFQFTEKYSSYVSLDRTNNWWN